MSQPFSPDYRISDAERQQAMEDLGNHFAAGRLDVTEYDKRLTDVTNVVMRSELKQLFTDLPPLTQKPSFQPSIIENNKSKLPLYIGLGIGAFLLLMFLIGAPFLLFLIWPGIMCGIIYCGVKFASKPPNPQNNYPQQNNYYQQNNHYQQNNYHQQQ